MSSEQVSSEKVERYARMEERIHAIEQIGQHGRMPNYWRKALLLALVADDVVASEQAEEIERLRPENVDARGDYWRALAEQQGREIEAKQKALRQITRCHSCSRAKELARAALSTQPKDQ